MYSERDSDETLPRTLARIQAEWGLLDEQMAALIHVPVATYLAWRAPAFVSDATVPPGMETAVPLVSIYKRICAKHPETEAQARWMITPHTDFGDNKPIDVAASSIQNLYWVSYYLETSAH